jgi:hypothetical protein
MNSNYIQHVSINKGKTFYTNISSQQQSPGKLVEWFELHKVPTTTTTHASEKMMKENFIGQPLTSGDVRDMFAPVLTPTTLTQSQRLWGVTYH